MCEFHESTCNGFGDIWWTDNPIYFSSIDSQCNGGLTSSPNNVDSTNQRQHYCGNLSESFISPVNQLHVLSGVVYLPFSRRVNKSLKSCGIDWSGQTLTDSNDQHAHRL